MVHAGGRPRTVSPPPEECIELGEDFVKWATEETEEMRCQVAQWYALRQGMLRSDWKSLIQCPQFLPYYNQGISALALKCIDGTMKEGFGHRYVRHYDRDLKEEEDQDAREKLAREKEKIDYEAAARRDSLSSAISDFSDLKRELLKDISE